MHSECWSKTTVTSNRNETHVGPNSLVANELITTYPERGGTRVETVAQWVGRHSRDGA